MRSFLRLLLVLTTLPLAAVPTAAQKDRLQLLPARPRQGDGLFVRLDQPAAENPEVTWLRKTYPLYRQGERWVAAVPIPPGTRPGGHTVTVTFDRGEGPQRLRRHVEIARVRYPVQHLRMARTTARLYNYPGVEVEDRTISEAIRTVSEDRLWRGDWALPAKGRLSTPFGVQRLRNGKAVGRHRGLDIAAPEGAPVLAAATGRVALAGSFRKHGKTVVLDHGMGVTSLYIHLSAIKVREGDTVTRGARLGSIGSTGVSTGPHLHWSIYLQGEPVEPLMFVRLSKRGVRI